jgi:hypothetical protein
VHIGDFVTSAKVVKTWYPTLELQVVDQDGSPVANAQVSGHWSTGDLGFCITDDTGWCKVGLAKLPTAIPSVEFTVIDIAADGYLYDATANIVDPDASEANTYLVPQ